MTFNVRPRTIKYFCDFACLVQASLEKLPEVNMCTILPEQTGGRELTVIDKKAVLPTEVNSEGVIKTL